MRHTVSNEDTALAIGSGDLSVLATPMLIAWLEAATVRATEGLVSDDQTTVGTSIRVNHRRPTLVGDHIDVDASAPDSTRRRLLTFRVQALGSAGEIIAEGEIDRAIVDIENFLDEAGALSLPDA